MYSLVLGVFQLRIIIKIQVDPNLKNSANY